MTVQLIDQEITYTTPEVPADHYLDNEYDLVDAYGGGGLTGRYLNKAWYTISPLERWVFWFSDDAPDISGVGYPGPGNFGDCTNYRVETVVYQE